MRSNCEHGVVYCPDNSFSNGPYEVAFECASAVSGENYHRRTVLLRSSPDGIQRRSLGQNWLNSFAKVQFFDYLGEFSLDLFSLQACFVPQGFGLSSRPLE